MQKLENANALDLREFVAKFHAREGHMDLSAQNLVNAIWNRNAIGSMGHAFVRKDLRENIAWKRFVRRIGLGIAVSKFVPATRITPISAIQ